MIHFFKNKILLVLATGAMFLTSSCKKKFIDLAPPTSVDPATALNTEADLLIALRGAYAGFRNVDLYGRTVPVIGDIMGDNTYQHSTNTNRYTLYNSNTFTSGDANALGLWASAYTVILRANRVIASPVTSNVNVDQYKGEAYAIRALAYFTLVRYFARPYTDAPTGLGVPIVLVYDPEYKPARNTVAEVYTQINDDLNKAYTLMTKPVLNSSQFSKYAAKGLQAKVYLTMGNKASALTAAQDVINNSGFTSITAANYVSYWQNGTVRTDKLETLFEVSSDAVANLAFDALSYIYSQNGNYGDLVIAPNMYSQFAAGDIRLAVLPIVNRPKPSGPLVPTVDKFPVISGDLSDTKVLRMSDIYLIAAEASLPGDEVGARTYLNFITSRRNAAMINSTGATLFEDVITERRKELGFEGDRYMDLMRLKRDVVRTTNGVNSVTILYTNFRRILPIPQTELDANPNIRTQQNPGF